MNPRIVIIGAGGHGKAVANIAVKCGYSEIAFVDDNATGECLGYPIIGTCSDLPSCDNKQTDFVIAVGNANVRREIAGKYNLNYKPLIHPSAQIGIAVKIGMGTVVMPGAIINPGSETGVHCIINSAAVVEHDNLLGDYVHISPNAALGGTVRVGDNTHIGIGAIVRNNIDICGNCVIGAGAVVVKNIVAPGIYIGVPARIPDCP